MQSLLVDSGAFAHNALGNDQMAGLMIIVRLRVYRQSPVAAHGCHHHWARTIRESWWIGRRRIRLAPAMDPMR